MRNVYLTASVRTSIGRFGGALASWPAADLGVAVAKASIERGGLRPDQIQQSIWGCARQAGGGANVARQITYLITTTLVHEMRRRSVRLGLSTLCVSGGMGIALLLERA